MILVTYACRALPGLLLLQGIVAAMLLLLTHLLLLLLHQLHLLIVLLLLLCLLRLLGCTQGTIDSIDGINVGYGTNMLGIHAVSCARRD